MQQLDEMYATEMSLSQKLGSGKNLKNTSNIDDQRSVSIFMSTSFDSTTLESESIKTENHYQQQQKQFSPFNCSSSLKGEADGQVNEEEINCMHDASLSSLGLDFVWKANPPPLRNPQSIQVRTNLWNAN